MDAHPGPAAGAADVPAGLGGALARAVTERPGATLLAWGAVCLLAGLLAWGQLGVRTERTALIGDQHAFNRRFAQLSQDFPDLDALVVLAWAEEGRGGDPAQFLDDLAEALREQPGAFAGSFHRVPADAFRGQALLFLEAGQLEAIARRLDGAAASLSRLVPAGLPAFLRQAAERVRERLRAGATSASAEDRDELGFLTGLLGGLEASLQGGAAPPPPWSAWLPAEARDGLIHTRDGKLILLAQPAAPHEASGREQAVNAMRALLDRLLAAHAGVRAGLTGGPVLEVDEMRTWRRDAGWATLATFLGVGLLTTLALRRLAATCAVTLAVGAAVVLTLGLAAIWPGQLNLISVAFCSLMLGLGVDSGIHLVGRADEERGEGLAAAQAWARALRRVGPPVLAGACSTALAFLATLFTEVQGIREFGVVAGEGVLLSLLASATLLPALLLRWEAGRAPPRRAPGRGLVRRLLRPLDAAIARRPAGVALGVVALAGLGGVYAFGPLGGPARRLRYEGNLLQLQASGLESVQLAGEVLADQAVAGMFAVVVAERLDDLERVERAVRALPAVDHTESILDVVPPAQEHKLAVLARLQEGLGPVALPPDPIRAGSLAAPELAGGLRALGGALEEAANQALAGGSPAFRDAFELGERLEALARAVEAAGPEGLARASDWEAGLREALRQLLLRLREECQARPMSAVELPEPVRARFQGRSGRYLLRVYPREDPWDEAAAGRFLGQLLSVVPDVSGVPVQLYMSNQLLRSGYRSAAQIALGFLLFALVLHFRGLVLPLVVLSALLSGVVLAAGAMAVLGVPLNPASLIALPLTVGIGVDAAIHLVHRARERHPPGSVAGPGGILDSGAGRAALISAATTLVCFVALGVCSHHRGVASIGWACSLGVLCTLLTSFALVPALMQLLQGTAGGPHLVGLPGPKTGPGGAPRRPPVQDPPPDDR